MTTRYRPSRIARNETPRRHLGCRGGCPLARLRGGHNHARAERGTETTEAGTQSFQPAQATDDRAFDEARAEAVPLILKAEDELDQVTFPNTPDLSIDLGHVSRAKDLVGQAGHIFEGVDDEIAGHLFSAQNHLIGAISIIGGGYMAARGTRELHAAADDIDAVIGLLGLAITT